RFSTVQFFLKQDEQSTQKRKLRNLLLLAMRLLLFALLVLAFARPYFPQSQTAAAGQRRRQVIFVVDRSASMYATGTEGVRWAQAKEMLRKILSDLPLRARAALTGCSTRSEVLSEFAPSPAIAKLLNDLP